MTSLSLSDRASYNSQINHLLYNYPVEQITYGNIRTIQMQLIDALEYANTVRDNIFNEENVWLRLNVTDLQQDSLPINIANIKCWIQMGFYYRDDFIIFMAPVKSDDYSKINDIYKKIKHLQLLYISGEIQKTSIFEIIDVKYYNARQKLSNAFRSIARFFDDIGRLLKKLDTI